MARDGREHISEQARAESDTDGEDAAGDVGQMPIDGTLDLHTFRPDEIGDLIPDYLELCRQRGIHEIRIVHGKGRGQLRRGVHAVLDRLPTVQSYALAPEGRGAWGATLVQLSRSAADADARAPEPGRRSASAGPRGIDTARGVLVFLLVCANTTVLGTPLAVLGFAKALIPIPAFRTACTAVLTWLAESWVAVNNTIIKVLIGGSWEVSGLEALEPGRSYLVSANHQSWTDIVVLQRVLYRRIPFLRFFIKQELIWVPILGLCWWGLDFPFMKRYSREYLEKHPEKRGADMEATRRSCARLRDVDLCLTNFLEGTRFTPAKHRSQKSPYRSLLSPRAGGVAFVLGALGEKLTEMVDVTISYPDGAPKMWDFFCGRARRIIVDVKVRHIPTELRRGDYAQDEGYRTAVQNWVHEIWTEKDDLIASLERGRSS